MGVPMRIACAEELHGGNNTRMRLGLGGWDLGFLRVWELEIEIIRSIDDGLARRTYTA